MRKALLSLLILIANNLTAQPITHTWAKSCAGIGINNDKLRITKDDVGNIYMIGEFSGTRSFGVYSLTAVGDVDVFVAKFDNVGVCQWAIKCSGAQFTTNKAGGITIDDNYNLYISGTYNQSMTITTQTVTAIGNNEIFIARLDNAGNCVWLKSAGANFQDQANDIVFDGTQSIYVTGSFEAFAYFDATIVNGNASTVDIFLAKYDLTGTLLWVKTAGGNDVDVSNAVEVDNAGNPIITGSYSTTATFGTTNVVSVAFGDLFVAKYNVSGTVSWVARAGGKGQDVGNAISLDAANNVYIAGNNSDTTFFGTIQLNDNGYGNGFFAKFNASNGAISYAKRVGSSNSDAIYDISAETGGSIYITGQFSGLCYFGTAANGNGALPSLSSTPATNNDAFVAKFNGLGIPIWTFKIGGSSADFGKSVVALGAGKVLAAGNFSGTVSCGSTSLTSSSGFGVYLSELNGGTVGILNPSENNSLTVFPNPVKNILNVTLPQNLHSNYSISVFDITGKTLLVNKFDNNTVQEHSINLKDFASGIYQIQLISESSTYTGKFIVE